MNADPQSAKAIFLEAVERHAPDRWPAFLDRACAGQPDLRGQVEALLEAHREVGTAQHSELGGTDPRPVVAVDEQPMREQPGAVIGPYKLLQAIGEGGMGTVYLAEQTAPVRRQVALKVIKAGMDSRQVLARFEAERQALALMDHPNIAKVLDAGATEQGRPYFVMELVKGIPITQFCDERRLSPRERLELAIPVCQAVQHAHQKGVIHRDLKPSNVLVALYDDRPVPKVIDFGIAKATGPRLTEQTLYTEFGAVVGTLEYMSPEQAQLNQLDIDTRSDIYSLGVLLYELLTGTTPLERKRLKEAALLELLRLVREEESPRPSRRLSTTEELPSIAACRNIEPRKLSGLLRGELDWIVMKALEKNRNRRYETASGLAADLRRYLDDGPVQAGPPSAWYRFRKFARRHRAALTTATLLALALIVGTIVSTWQALRARQAEHVARSEGKHALEAEKRATRERDEARAQRQRADARFQLAFQAVTRLREVFKDLRSSAGPERTAKMQRAVTEDLIRFHLHLVENNEDDPAVTYEVGDAFFYLGGLYLPNDPERRDWAFFKALAVYERRARESPDDTATLSALAFHYWRLASRRYTKEPERAEATYRQALDICERVAREHPDRVDHWVVSITLAGAYGDLLRRQDRAAEAEALDRRVLAWFERPQCDLGSLDAGEQRDSAFGDLSSLLVRCGKPLMAIPILARQRPHLVFDRHYEWYLSALTDLCLCLTTDPDPAIRARAVALARENVDFLARTNARTWLLLGIALEQTRDLPGADDAFRRGIELGGDDASTLNGFAWLLVSDPRLGSVRPSSALRIGEQAVRLDPHAAQVWNTLGVARYRAGEWEAAIDALAKAEGLAPGKHFGFNAFFLAMAHWQKGERDEARSWYDKAVSWTETNRKQDEELRRFRSEAAALLRLPGPSAPAQQKRPRP